MPLSRPLLRAAAALLPWAALPAISAAQCDETTRESLAPGDVEALGESVLLHVSDDARYVTFESTANNLVPGDGNGVVIDLFRRDRSTGEVERINAPPGGGDPNGSAFGPYGISADGRFVAFDSAATNLVAAPDSNAAPDVFVRDAELDSTERISQLPDGTIGNGLSWRAHISPDGRYVIFASRATNFAPGDTNGEPDIFVHDRLTKIKTRISVDSNGVLGNHASSDPWISEGGVVAVFTSSSSNLVPNDTNGAPDVFVHHLPTGVTTRVSVSSAGAQGNDGSDSGPISRDGRYVLFESSASNLVPGDTNGVVDVFRRDRLTGETVRASVDTNGAQAPAGASLGWLSADGRFAAFTSASPLSPEDVNDYADAYHRDLFAGITTLVSKSSSGEGANDHGPGLGSYATTLAADGRVVGVGSFASNLVPDDTNGAQDVFLHTLWPAPLRYCQSTPNSTGAAARIEAHGDPSVSACTLVLRAAPVPDQPGLFYFGPNAIELPFGNGFRCVGGGVFRLPVASASNNVLEHALDLASPPADLIAPGSLWRFQAWFRDPAAGGAGFDLSDGLVLEFCP